MARTDDEAAMPSSAPSAPLIDVSALEIEEDALVGVTNFMETEAASFVAAEDENEAESAAYLLSQSHALVAELRVVVAARAAYSATNR